MVDHVYGFELKSNRTNGSLGLDPQHVITSNVSDFQGVQIEWSGTQGVLPRTIIPPSAHGNGDSNQESYPGESYCKKVVGSVQVAGGSPNIAYVVGNQMSVWQIEGGAAQQGSPLAPCIVRNSGNVPDGRTSPRSVVSFSGNAAVVLGALLAGNGGGIPGLGEFHLEWGYGPSNPYQNLSHFVDFGAIPPNGTSDSRPALQRLLNLINGASSVTNLGNLASGPLLLNDCGAAFIAPEGAVYIEPGDYGTTEADSIPTDRTQNSANPFRFHPSVFLRRTSYYSGISVCYEDQLPFNAATATQPFRIVTVDNQIGDSNWLVILDGAPLIVTLQHPEEGDFRRPRDIWQNVWVPILNGSQSPQFADAFGIAFGGGLGGPSFKQLQSRLRFAEYFRCLPLPGDEQTQTGGGG